MIAAAPIFLGTYAVVALGRLPGLRLDRAGAALIGACLMVGFEVLSLEDAYRAIDLNTIVLLVGMMILVANLKLAGFFALAARWIAGHARHPLSLLSGIILVSGALSAFLVNDTVCLMLTPLVAELALGLRRNPVPYLLSLAMASNIGSTATITGNPQNILIGSFSGIRYAQFAGALAPVAGLGLVVLFTLVALMFRPSRRSCSIARLRVIPERADLAAPGGGVPPLRDGRTPPPSVDIRLDATRSTGLAPSWLGTTVGWSMAIRT
jgi:Na+/H+ antiporter NhaD/arsenite permease-like protein